MGWMMPFMGIFWLIGMFLFFGLMMGMFRRHGGMFDRHYGGSTALATLEERYARGDINRDEYLQKKQDILARS
jgi:putative membrane protein